MITEPSSTPAVPAKPRRPGKPKTLSLQQEKFLAAYARHGDVRRAMTLAGYRKGYPSGALLRQTTIRMRLDQIRARLQAQANAALPKDSVLRELAAITFSDIGQLYTDSGQPIPLSQLPSETRAAVQQYARTRHGTTVKMYDKLQAIELSMRHLGLLEKETATGLTVQITIGTLAAGQLDPILQAKSVESSGSVVPVIPQAIDK
jgi:hypothetical protein